MCLDAVSLPQEDQTEAAPEETKAIPHSVLRKTQSFKDSKLEKKYFSPQIGGFYDEKNLPPLLSKAKDTLQPLVSLIWLMSICSFG